MSEKIVIFAEKPSQAKNYAEAFTVKNRTKDYIELAPCSTFPNGATIVWAIGHLVELVEPVEYKEEWGVWSLNTLPIYPSKFKFRIKKEHKDRFKAIKDKFLEATVIYHCGDIDREGDNVFGSILQMCGLDFKSKPIKRLWITSMEVDVIRKGFTDLKDVDVIIPRFYEARTRMYSDWLIGMNLSRLYSLILGAKGLKGDNARMNVGRVMTPTINLVYQRQLEVENFVSKPFYELVADFTNKQGQSFKGKASIKEFNKERLLDLLSENHLQIGKRDNGTVLFINKEVKETTAPKLHSLSSLQIKLNKKYHYSPSDTLTYVQNLYDKKFLTYPRTSCQYITESEYAYLLENVEKYKAFGGYNFNVVNDKARAKYVNNKKVEEHYAIVLTRKVPTQEEFNGFTKEEQNVYLEILRSVLAMFHANYKYEETTLQTLLKGIEFITKGKVILDNGFKELWETEKAEGTSDSEKDEEANQLLPQLNPMEVVSGIADIKEGKTTPPKLLTEGDLTQAMVNASSGNIVELEDDEKEVLKEVEGIGTEATRSTLIKEIQRKGYVKLEKNYLKVTTKGKIICEALKDTLLTSPAMTAKWEMYLQTIGKGEGSPQKFLKNIQKFIDFEIANASKRIDLKSSVGTAIKEVEEEEVLGKCPICKTGNVIDKGKMYGCTNYRSEKSCDFTIQKNLLEKRITANHVQALLTKNLTSKIKGFVSKKSGKSFNARLSLNAEGKIDFKFEK